MPVAPPVAPPPVAAPTPPPEEPELSEEDKIKRANYAPSSVRFGGYLQAQYRSKQDNDFQSDTNGFRAKAVRLTGDAKTRAGNLELSATLEAELQPQFALLDGYATVARAFDNGAKITFDGGQARVPVSRQNLLSDSRMSFTDKALLASISPGRDLGARLAIDLPRPKPRRHHLRLPGVRVWLGAFNGEGINQIENINQRFLYTGRLEITAIGEERVLADSAFGGTYLKLAGSLGRNKRTEGQRLDRQTYLGFDISGAYKGVSGSIEYLEVRHAETTLDESMSDPNNPDFKANGFNAQLCYMLPFALAPYKQARLELGGRFEEIDRNDTLPITVPGDPNQSVRAITAIASYYLRMHSIKAQLAYTHFTEIEDRTQGGENATFDNDQLLLQVTYRLE